MLLKGFKQGNAEINGHFCSIADRSEFEGAKVGHSSTEETLWGSR